MKRCVHVRRELDPNIALSVSAGPWTVATYMVPDKDADGTGAEYGLSPSEAFAKSSTCWWRTDQYLAGQLKAGADVLQIFDTGPACCRRANFRLSVEPTRRIVEGLCVRKCLMRRSSAFPEAPARCCRPMSTPPARRRQASTGRPSVVIRDACRTRRRSSNLDPLVLIAGGAALDRAIDDVLGITPGQIDLNLATASAGNSDRACRADDQAVRAYRG